MRVGSFTHRLLGFRPGAEGSADRIHNGSMREPDDARYGVFLPPDAKTSAAVTNITSFVQAQFGLVSAGRFPPHVTLAGSLPLAVGESELLAVVGSVAAAHPTFEVHNSGVDRLGESVVFNVHNDGDGKPNAALIDLAIDLARDLRPLLRATDGLAADLRGRDSWRGHLSLASHELIDRVDLREEVERFIRQLETPIQAASRRPDQIAERRAAPNWSQRVATAPTIVREARIEEGWDWQSERLAGIAVPTLLLTGSESPPGLAEVTSLTAAAIPGARVHVLAGHGPVAHVSEPGVVAQVLRNWLE